MERRIDVGLHQIDRVVVEGVQQVRLQEQRDVPDEPDRVVERNIGRVEVVEPVLTAIAEVVHLSEELALGHVGR